MESKDPAQRFKDLGYSYSRLANTLEGAWRTSREYTLRLRCIAEMRGRICMCSAMSPAEDESGSVVPELYCVILYGAEHTLRLHGEYSSKCVECGTACPNLYEVDFDTEKCKDFTSRKGKYQRPCLYMNSGDEQIEKALELHRKEILEVET